MRVTPEDRTAWTAYEAANAAAAKEYVIAPSVAPYLSDHFLCVCCETPTIQPVGICLSCQVFVMSDAA